MTADKPDKKDLDRPLPGNEANVKNDSCIQARHALAFMAFLGFFNVYCLRVNLSVALVAMVNSSSSDNGSVSDECPDSSDNSNSTSTSTGEFEWDENTQGLILGAFFYGYTVTQLPGGWLAEPIGGKKLFGIGCLGTALLTLFTPLAARAGVAYLVLVRVLEGITEGVTSPAMHSMWGEWAPIYERSKLSAVSLSGAQLGTVIAMPISGLLCQHGFADGWPSVFYLFGTLLPAVLMVGTGYVGWNHQLAVVLLTLGVGHVRLHGTLLGITNAIATIPGFLGPAVVGFLTNHNETPGQWRLFFYITAGLYLCGALLFILLGRGEEQSWAKVPPGVYSDSTLNQEQTISVQDSAFQSAEDCSVNTKGDYKTRL